ncbi:MAG: sn-glycerol-3-phosphate ABC transporter ATP-binding protein UgpC [Spirochaetales bacterium]|nr:sn-glycerol-3-phosphate ABC transporter ATP-binding protein UgpC [Spirochaetales bacterium]
MTDLSIKNINKIYSGGVHAVKNFTMEIEKGEFIAFVGPSGCGKSTMLRMIAGLEEISEGDLVLQGKRINDVAPADRDIAMVFQNYALFGNMSVYENIGFPLTIRHTGGDEIYEKVMESAETVEILNELNRKPKQLSGGQRQRVAIGRSLVRHPKVFLMDEPLSNLDAKLRTQTRKELAALHERLGSTFIYVTHDQVEAMTMADRIVIMNQGVVQQIGSPNEVNMNPANIFVGGFIGSPAMNFVDGHLEDRNFKSADLSIPVPSDLREFTDPYNSKKLVLGVRPENFRLEGDDAYKMRCRVDIIEYLGCEYIVHFTHGDLKYRARLNVGYLDAKIGDDIDLFIDPRGVRFFDADTEFSILKDRT